MTKDTLPDVFHFNEKKKNFDDYGNDNSFRFWFARDLMTFLGYDDYNTFRRAINRAVSACASLNIPYEENFHSVDREIEGKTVADFKLSRFACYLTAMNGDVKKKEVAQAQAFFITYAETLKSIIQKTDGIERVIVRDEITSKEKSLSSIVKTAGIEMYPFFQNAGYRGLYNMNMSDLKQFRGLKKNESLLDYMGKTELAANLFRITQTEDKIKNDNIRGQKNLEETAEIIGIQVRKTIIDIQGTGPEFLPKHENIKDVKKKLKQTSKEFKKIDKKSSKK